jgi:hypothetical protein
LEQLKKENPVLVYRLGEFSPIGRLFTLGWFLKNQKKPKLLGYLFPKQKLCFYFDPKSGWPTLWAIFFSNASCHSGFAKWKKTHQLCIIL